MLGWAQDDMALAAGVSLPTVKRLEAAGGMLGGRIVTAGLLVEALEAAGIIFIDENGEGPGVRLRKSRAGDTEA